MPDLPDRGLLTIEFRRAHLQEPFVRGFFLGEDKSVRKNHPFASPGIEAILTDKRLILNIHSGVVLHLRNGMSQFQGYETFVDENVKGRVTEVEGNVFSSSDSEYINIKLGDYYVSTFPSLDINLMRPGSVKQQPDGSYIITDPLKGYEGKLPVRYPPKVIEGP
jgi:hypothetical protein